MKTDNLQTNDPILNFLLDDDFIAYVFHPETRLTKAWSHYFLLHPSSYEFAEKARKILLGESEFFEISRDHLLEVKHRILNNLLISKQS